MTCRDFVSFLLDYVEGALPPHERRRFDEHLSVCPDCVEYLAQYLDVIRAGKLAFADDLPEEVPDQLVDAILSVRRT